MITRGPAMQLVRSVPSKMKTLNDIHIVGDIVYACLFLCTCVFVWSQFLSFIFGGVKYKGKRPTPNERLDGRLDGVKLDSSNIASLFSLVVDNLVDNISFLGNGPTTSASSAGTTGPPFSFSSSLFF